MSEEKVKNPQSSEKVDEGTKSFVGMLKVLFFVLRIVIIVIYVYIMFRGIFYVKEQQEALLFRFGKLVTKGDGAVLKSGRYYFSWPEPIDAHILKDVQRSMTVTSKHFWPAVNPNALLKAGQSPDQAKEKLAPGQDGYVLTGDLNIMHVISSVTYKIDDLQKYYLNYYQSSDSVLGNKKDAKLGTASQNQLEMAKEKSRTVEKLIQNALDQAVLAEIVTWSVEDVIVKNRTNPQTGLKEMLDEAIKMRTIKLINDLDIGVEVLQVSLLEVSPPLITQDAFRQVNDAAQEARTSVENAKAYAKKVVTEAEGKKAEIISEAKAYKTRVVATVKADGEYFSKIVEEYKKNPETMLVALYTDTIQEILPKAESIYSINAKEDGKQEVRLLINEVPAEKTANSATK